MKYIFSFFILLAFSGIAWAQIVDPIPEEIVPAGIEVELREVVTIPPSSGAKPFTRINLLREAPDESGRLFVNDLRGKFWIIDSGEPIMYLDMAEKFSAFVDAPGLGTGFGAFAFDPEFAQNGIFYTSHAERPEEKKADFTPIEFNSITLQWVITEWSANDPSSNSFEGTKREILRFDYPGNIHGMQEIAFNPTAGQGESDYGMLYICLGDGRSSLSSFDKNIQTIQSFLGTIFRIDPKGNNSENGQYGIPEDNPFTETADSLSIHEIYAYGFRNPHRISWDVEGDHKMLEGDIGEKNIEEINLIRPGNNYGWNKREGTFLYDLDLDPNFIFELPADDSIYGYSYPVAQYDHDEGFAVIGGYVYRGDVVPELKGQYIFGDLVRGRLFYAQSDELEDGKQALISEFELVDENGDPTDLLELVDHFRADLRFGVDNQNELYMLTKVDGKVRLMVDPNSTSVNTIAQKQVIDWVLPNPSQGIFFVNKDIPSSSIIGIQVYNAAGIEIYSDRGFNNSNVLDLSSFPAGMYLVHIHTEELVAVQKIMKL
jgi:glucose/arabinose dehydrogenase